MVQSGSEGDILHPLEVAEWHLWVLRISKIIARAWTDEAFKQELLADPAAALRAVGLAVPTGAEVVVEEGGTSWSMSGSSLTRMDRLTLPLPPKPTADALLTAWAAGETGHPPILSDQGAVAFSGLPAHADGAAPWRTADGRRVFGDGGLPVDAAARRVGAARRIVDDSDFSSADSVARRTAEARRIIDDEDPMALDAEARRTTEARRIVDENGPEAADAAGRRTSDARRVGDDEGPTAADAAGRRVAGGRRATEDGDGPRPPKRPVKPGQKPAKRKK